MLGQSPLTFLMQQQSGATFTTTIEFGLVTINPIPQTRILAASDGSGRMVGYVELSTFISTAEPVFEQVLIGFKLCLLRLANIGVVRVLVFACGCCA